jgi:hypothetical protein
MERTVHLSLTVGAKTEITKKVASWTAGFPDGTRGPQVELVASIELDPIIQSPGEKRLMATTLAIRMDPKVAIELVERIRELDLTRDWPQPR